MTGDKTSLQFARYILGQEIFSLILRLLRPRTK
jgi:hypothetical protein